MTESKSKMKKAVAKKTLSKKYVYLREVQIKFKKKRIKSDSPVGKSVTNSKIIYQIFKDLENGAKEKLIIISVDAQLRIMCFEVVAIGSLTTLTVRPIDILRGVIHVAPYGLVFVHNHPSGDPEPSKEDIQITQRLQEVGNIVGIKVLDHIIVGNGRYVSLRDKGVVS